MVDYSKIVIPYRTTLFTMTLNDLKGYFSCSKPLWIQCRGNIAFGCSYLIINAKNVVYHTS